MGDPLYRVVLRLHLEGSRMVWTPDWVWDKDSLEYYREEVGN